jgi:hypothetical protein
MRSAVRTSSRRTHPPGLSQRVHRTARGTGRRFQECVPTKASTWPRLNAPTNGITTNSFSSYRYRFVIWDNTVRFPGLKASEFIKPSAQIVYHENQDFHYKRLASSYTTTQPTLNAIYADFHAELWKVQFRQNRPERYYDPNWFTYGPNGVLNTDSPNIGYDVHTGWDLK